MYSISNENELIEPDVASALQDYVSIQLDIDSTKIKAAALIAQRIDIARVIGKDNLSRCILDPTGQNQQTTADEQLTALVKIPWLYFTYSRLLTMFQGVYTDSGLILSEENAVESRSAARQMSNEIRSIAETFMIDVIDFLEEEADNDLTKDLSEVKTSESSNRIRVFGGKENRGSN